MKTENKQYKLKKWYPTLPNDWKTEHDYVYYKEESLMVNKLLMTTHIINFKHLEYRDFWEEVKQPLFVTDDGVELFDEADKLFIVNKKCYKKEIRIYNIYDKANRKDFKYFNVEENADKYIEENKPKPLFITEDGVEYTHLSQQVWGVSERFEKRTYWVSQIKGTKVKAFYHEANADEYIWRNKRVFSYEDMLKAKHSIILADEDIEKAAKERSCNG